MKHAKSRIFVFILFLALFIPVSADEGMWLFNMPPVDILKAKYNFAVTSEWLKNVQLASVRFGGASGSFVSPEGLVLTNHHVGQGAIQNLSTKDRDLMKTWFYAKTRSEELKCPGLELSVLQEIVDVTSQVAGAETPGMTPAQAAEARNKVIAALEKQNSEQSGLRCNVVNLYSGSITIFINTRFMEMSGWSSPRNISLPSSAAIPTILHILATTATLRCSGSTKTTSP